MHLGALATLLLTLVVGGSAMADDSAPKLFRPPAKGKAGKGPNVLVFFGTFDPFHEGHYNLSKLAKKHGFDEGLITANGDPPFRDNQVTPFRQRLRMIKARVQDDPELNVLLQDNTHFITHKDQMVPFLRKAYGPNATFTMLYGADAFERGARLGSVQESWGFHYLVVERDGKFDRSSIPPSMRKMVKVVKNPVDFSVSGTEIRNSFAEGTRLPKGKLHPRVARIVRSLGLYKPGAAKSAPTTKAARTRARVSKASQKHKAAAARRGKARPAVRAARKPAARGKSRARARR